MDDVRYGIDWDNDSVVDEWLPESPDYLSSGVQVSTTHSWDSEGPKTFQALTKNDGDVTSLGWTQHVITIDVNDLPTAEIKLPASESYPIGTEINFKGLGEDIDGDIVNAEWRDFGESSDMGDCSNETSGIVLSTLLNLGTGESIFATTTLSVGNHNICFRVRDDDGAWSEIQTRTINISSGSVPNAGIYSMLEGFSEGASVPFAGWGIDSDGRIVEAEWRDYGESEVEGCNDDILSPVIHSDTFTDTELGEVTSFFSTTTLSVGSHNICFRAKGLDNIWSLVATKMITIFGVTGSDCSDGLDNDGDGLFDDGLVGEGEDITKADPGCYDYWTDPENPVYNSAFNSESPNPFCSDDIDNDNDGYPDELDAGCYPEGTAVDSLNMENYNPFDNDENNCNGLACEAGETYQACPTDCPFMWIEF